MNSPCALHQTRYASPAATDDLLQLIYRGPLETQPWQSFVNRLREMMDALALSIVLYPNENQQLEIHVLANEPGRDIDWTTLERRYIRDHLEVDPTASKRIAPGEIMNSRDIKDSRYFAEFLYPLGIEHTVRMGFSEPTGMRCWLAACRSKNKGAFSDDDIGLLQYLLPHLEQALALYARIMLSRSEKSLYEDAIGHLAFGSILLDGERRIISANSTANAIIERNPELAVVDTKLTLTDGYINAELQRAIDAALASRSRGQSGTVEAVRVECRNGKLLGMLIRPAPQLPYYHGNHIPNAIIYLSDLEQQIEDWRSEQRDPQLLIAKLFKLTPAESRLALLLADGKTLADAAVIMNITEKTVRNHSKNIYDKTGINRQVDLVRLIYKSVALLG